MVKGKIDKGNAGLRTGFRGTKAQIRVRENEIEQLMAAGYSNRSIFRYISEKYGITSRQTENYMADIVKKWEKEFEPDTKKNLVKALKSRESIIEKTYAEKDYKTALSALDSKAELQGLFKNRTELSGEASDFNLNQIKTSEEKSKVIKELEVILNAIHSKHNNKGRADIDK